MKNIKSERVRGCPLQDWPISDREAWQQACVLPSRRLKAGGAAGHMKASTQTSLVRAYGYLLEFRQRTGIFDQNAEVVAHVTPEIIDAFVDDLRHRVGSVTRASYISRIHRFANILAPERDLDWLHELERELHHEARPRPKYHRIVPSDRLLSLGLQLIERGNTGEHLSKLTRARLVRDGLMIALLSICPIRLGNLANLRIGHQLQRIGDTWWIILRPSETKSRRPDERPIPEILTSHINDWIENWRQLFLDPADAFWPSTKGGALAYTYVGEIITRTTLQELGVAVNPHLFRDCAVHTIATVAGDQMGVATQLLQHADSRTTEKHYNKGASIGAVRRYHEILDQSMNQ